MDDSNYNANATSPPAESTIGLQDVLFNIAIGFIGAIGIIGNGTVCFVIVKVKSMRTATNILILNQSILDLTISLVFVLSYLGPTIDPLSDTFRETVFCKFWLSLYPLWSLFDSSSLNLVAITFERYFAIVHPVMHHNKFKGSGVRGVIAAIWLSGFSIEWFWPYVHFIDNGVCTNHFNDKHLERFVGLMVFFVEYLFPMTVFIYCYVKIFIVLRTRVKEHATNTVASNQGSTYTKASQNVTKTLCVVVITYFVCWTVPSLAYFQNWVFGGPLDWNGAFYKFTVLSVFCNVCCNPIIYGLIWEHFRKALKQVFACKKSNKISPEQSVATVTRA
ncbi:galanin receptor type 1-like [Saccoglossus kowalevskii]|uniref:Galanin receptor type 1-like n=1 Tax=Saccoglossus kowalevskii TaxID=10224 RepID=A0ABM0LWU0_SACKO|nr:PREDICTED: galanin receptor type 1-like [Saccoglossus kowalevskii]